MSERKKWREKRDLPEVNDTDHFQKQAEIAIIREQCAADIMWEYVDHQHRINIMQLWFKGLFFAVVCLMFGVVIWLSLKTILTISQKSNIAIADVGVAVTSMVSLISAVIVLPTKIAEHLFPADGEKDITDFIVKMHESDTKTFNDRFDKVREDQDDDDFKKSQKEFVSDDNPLENQMPAADLLAKNTVVHDDDVNNDSKSADLAVNVHVEENAEQSDDVNNDSEPADPCVNVQGEEIVESNDENNDQTLES